MADDVTGTRGGRSGSHRKRGNNKTLLPWPNRRKASETSEQRAARLLHFSFSGTPKDFCDEPIQLVLSSQRFDLLRRSEQVVDVGGLAFTLRLSYRRTAYQHLRNYNRKLYNLQLHLSLVSTSLSPFLSLVSPSLDSRSLTTVHLSANSLSLSFSRLSLPLYHQRPSLTRSTISLSTVFSTASLSRSLSLSPSLQSRVPTLLGHVHEWHN